MKLSAMDLFLCGVFVQPGVAKDEGMKFAITTLEISRKYALALPSSSLTAAFNSQEWVTRMSSALESSTTSRTR